MNKTQRVIVGLITRAPDSGIHKKRLQYKLSYHHQIRIGDVALRKEIKAIVEQEGVAIGSTTDRGYFICKTQDDFDQAVKNLKSRLISLSVRISKLKETIEDKENIQLSLAL